MISGNELTVADSVALAPSWVTARAKFQLGAPAGYWAYLVNTWTTESDSAPYRNDGTLNNNR